jgi:hypothetical protein
MNRQSNIPSAAPSVQGCALMLYLNAREAAVWHLLKCRTTSEKVLVRAFLDRDLLNVLEGVGAL